VTKKKETFWIAAMAIIYVLLFKYCAVTPISNIVSATLFGWELADYI